MLDWLHGVVYTLYGYVPGPVKDLIHSALRGLIGALNAVTGNMWTVWWNWITAMTAAGGVFNWFCGGVLTVLSWLVKEAIPFASNLALRAWTRLLNFEKKIEADLLSGLQAVRDLASRLVQDAIAWVTQNVWNPLWGYIQDLYDKATRWAYTAWFYVTHPAALAELIFWSLWDVFTRNAWSVARVVGEWALRLVLQNSVSGVRLVEQIVTDVL